MITALNPEQMKQWSRWLWRSHRLRTLPNQIVYHCDVGYSLFLTPLTRLPHFDVRQDFNTDEITATFEIASGRQTIAKVQGGPEYVTGDPVGGRYFRRSVKHLQTAVGAGRAWWGTEDPVPDPHLTSFLYIFDHTMTLPDTTKLQPKGLVIPMDTNLELL